MTLLSPPFPASRPRLIVRQTDDDAAILTLDRACFPEDEPPRLDDRQWWIAWLDGEPVAYAGCSVVDAPSSKDGRAARFLSRCGVLPGARGLGLQRRLIRARECWVRGEGAAWCYTYTSAENTISANNLIACGYRLYDPVVPYARSTSRYWRRELVKAAPRTTP